MFSGEKSKREEATELLRNSSGAQVLLSAIILGCAITAVVKYNDDYYFNYHIGGFSCGIVGIIAGCLGLLAYQKASNYSGDDPTELQKQLGCKLCLQMILGYVLFMLSISGLMMAIMFLAIDYDSEDSGLKIHLILAICILTGIVLLLFTTFFTLRTSGVCCTHGYNNHTLRPQPTVGTTTFSYNNTTVNSGGIQPVFSTGGFNAQPNTSYPVSQFQPGHPPPQPLQPPPYGFQQNVFPSQQPTGPPPAYSY